MTFLVQNYKIGFQTAYLLNLQIAEPVVVMFAQFEHTY